jgi:hypothetical protein
LALLALAVATAHLSAQTCAPATDSLPAVLNAQFTRDGSPDSVPAVFAESLGAGIRAGLHPSNSVPTAAWTTTAGKTIPYLSGDISFTVNRDGSIRDVHVSRSTLVGAIDTALIVAVRGLDPAHPTSGDRERLILHVDLHVGQPPAGAAGVTLMHLTVPVWPHTTGPQLVRSADAESRGASGTATLQLVVDEKGRVIHGSERQLGPPNDRLFDGAKATVEHFEFTPLSLGGCPAKGTLVIPIRIN